MSTDREVIIIDTRSERDFLNGHIEHSVFLGFHHSQLFRFWLKAFIPDKHQSLYVVVYPHQEQVLIHCLKGMGYEQVVIIDLSLTGWQAKYQRKLG